MSSQFAIAFPADEEPTQRDLEPILLRADPSSLVVDPSDGALYVADTYSGAIVRVEHATATQRRIATIDAGGVIASSRIGGMSLAPDGALYVARVGYGQCGAVFRVVPGREPQPLPALPPRPWRGALAYDPVEHRLYATQYLRSSGPYDGAVVELDPVTGAPSMVLDGFLHPTGIVTLGSTLVVTDARQRAVFRVALAHGRGVLRLQLAGDVDRPEAVCAAGADCVLVASYDDVCCRGRVRRIWLDGKTRLVAEGPWEPRGVATDGERVFVSVRRTGQVVVYPLYF
jgi:sugar lactone lactonase YvrE